MKTIHPPISGRVRMLTQLMNYLF